MFCGRFVGFACLCASFSPSTLLAQNDALQSVQQARVVVFGGHGTADQVLIRGRVIVDPREPANPKTGIIANTLHNLDVLESDEVKFAPVIITLPDREIVGRTDSDGLFSLPVALAPRPLSVGVHIITVKLGDKPGYEAAPGAGRLFVFDTAPGLAVLSDFDDTIVNSHVANKPHLLWNTLTKNAAQLEPVPGASKAYRRAHAEGVDAFFYLSGSPIQLHERIHTYLQRNEFPDGVILLKNLGDDPLFAQLEYKIGRLEKVLATVPHLRFILIGDTGEKDPEIYRTIKDKHPQRIAAIVIRRAPGANHGPPSRFEGMIVVDNYRKQTELLANLVRQATKKTK